MLSHTERATAEQPPPLRKSRLNFATVDANENAIEQPEVQHHE